MTCVGTVESVWRYPVKSMRGEELPQAFLGYAGVYGDRLYAFRSKAARPGFPYFTGRELAQMLLYKAQFRDAASMLQPPNLQDAEAIAPGATPVYPEPADIGLDVVTPSGGVMAIDDPRLLELLSGDSGQGQITLHRSDRAMTDCRPVSLFAIGTAHRLREEVGAEIDKRRFRANVYLHIDASSGYAEDTLVGHRLRIGSRTIIAVTERDPRCKMITLDPDTAEQNPEILRTVNREHDNKAGVYGAVLAEGVIRAGDTITVID